MLPPRARHRPLRQSRICAAGYGGVLLRFVLQQPERLQLHRASQRSRRQQLPVVDGPSTRRATYHSRYRCDRRADVTPQPPVRECCVREVRSTLAWLKSGGVGYLAGRHRVPIASAALTALRGIAGADLARCHAQKRGVRVGKVLAGPTLGVLVARGLKRDKYEKSPSTHGRGTRRLVGKPKRDAARGRRSPRSKDHVHTPPPSRAPRR